MSIIRTNNLSYIYSKETPFEKKAVDNINIEIEEGSFVGIIGHTGSGKSTLIKHFNGLLEPDSGEIYIDGKNIWSNKDDIYKYRFKVGLVFQYPEHQLFEESVFKDIAFGPKNMGLSEDEIKNRVSWAIDIVGVSKDLLHRSPFELSGGQKRKVALAGIISMDPDVLILDEPTAGLDPKSKKMLLKNINLYHKKRKNTVILISHNMDDIANYCNYIILMNKAKIYMTGSVKGVFSNTEKLSESGLAPPVITEIFYLLNKKQPYVRKDINTIDEAVIYLKGLINK